MNPIEQNHRRIFISLIAIVGFLSSCSSDINHSSDPQSTALQQQNSSSSDSNNSATPPAPYFRWTELTPSATSRKIYLSNSGNDGNSCLSEQEACSSIARGESLLRDGEDDYLYFKRGDVWMSGLGNWNKSGKAADAPMVVTYYGDSGELPLFKTGANRAFEKGDPQNIHDVAFVGLDFIAHTRNYRSTDYVSPDGQDGGVRWINDGITSRLLIEGCRFQYYRGNVAIHSFGNGTFYDVKLRGNVLAYSYQTTPNVQGAYFDKIVRLVVEGNVFFHNGGTHNYPNDPHGVQLPGYSLSDSTITWYNHQLYVNMSTADPVIVRNNYFIGGDGSHVRGGQPNVEDNVYLRLIGSQLIGGGTEPVPGGITGYVRHNLFAEGTDFPAESLTHDDFHGGPATPSPRAIGISASNIGDGGLDISENLLMDEISTGDGKAIQLMGTSDCNPHHDTCPVDRATIERNVVLNAGELVLQDDTGVLLNNINVNNNFFYAAQIVSYPFIRLSNQFSPTDTIFSNNRYYRGGTDDRWFMDGAWAPGATQRWMTLPEWKTVSGETDAVAVSSDAADTSYTIYSYYQSKGGSGHFGDLVTDLLQQNQLHWNSNLEAKRVSEDLRSHYSNLLP
jgi:hypothetical protein